MRGKFIWLSVEVAIEAIGPGEYSLRASKSANREKGSLQNGHGLLCIVRYQPLISHVWTFSFLTDFPNSNVFDLSTDRKSDVFPHKMTLKKQNQVFSLVLPFDRHLKYTKSQTAPFSINSVKSFKIKFCVRWLP